MLAFFLSATSAFGLCFPAHDFDEGLRKAGYKLIAAGNLQAEVRMELYARSDGTWIQVHRRRMSNGYSVCPDEYGGEFSPSPPKEEPA